MLELSMSRWADPSVILVATDLNDLDRLMPVALQQAKASEARLILLHAPSVGIGMSIDAVAMPHYDPARAIEFAAKTIDPWRIKASEQDIACNVLVREGNAPQQIATVVRQFKADQIILGTRSRSRVSKLLLGSVAEQVLRSVNIPVITVGPEAHLAVESDQQQAVVLHATTLRETSRPSAALACQIASRQEAKLVLLHVLPPIHEMERDGLPTGLDSIAMRELRSLAGEIPATESSCCTQVEPRVAHGNPSIEILSTAAEIHAKLIVLGATYRPALQNLTRDRTVYRVLAHARCPVLTLRNPLAELPSESVEQTATQM
jgi:nucleotide-binding universal stress UspA family protein